MGKVPTYQRPSHYFPFKAMAWTSENTPITALIMKVWNMILIVRYLSDLLFILLNRMKMFLHQT